MRLHATYLVCATPRSGSSLLCEALASSGLAGRPEEYFWQAFEPEWSERWETTNFHEYLDAALRFTATSNGVFGAKIMWAHLDYFLGNVHGIVGQDLPPGQLLASIFPNFHVVWIHRRDVIRQAVSLWRAVQSGIWNERGEPKRPLEEASFDYQSIDRLAREIIASDDAWQRFFRQNGMEPYEVVYEDIAPDPESIARDILRWLDISAPEEMTFGKRRLRKQADALSEEWVQRYRAMQTCALGHEAIASAGAPLSVLDAFRL